MRLSGVIAEVGVNIVDKAADDATGDVIERAVEDVSRAGDMTWQDTDQIESGAYIYDPGFTGGVRVES